MMGFEDHKAPANTRQQFIFHVRSERRKEGYSQTKYGVRTTSLIRADCFALKNIALGDETVWKEKNMEVIKMINGRGNMIQLVEFY